MESAAVVIDCGTYATRIGHAGGSPMKYRSDESKNYDEQLVQSIEEKFELKADVFNKILVSRSPRKLPADLKGTIRTLFERLSFQRVYFALQPVLAMYGSNNETGVVVDVGHNQISITPVYYGYPIPEANLFIDHSGEWLSNQLRKSLGEKRGVSIEDYDQIKKNLCYVAEDYDTEIKDVPLGEYTLPSGEVINVKEARIKVPELLFQPEILGFDDHKALDATCRLSIMKTDVDLRAPLSSNVLLVGGGAQMPGLDRRLQAGLKFKSCKVTCVPECDEVVWRGGSRLAQMKELDELWLTKHEYEELGVDKLIEKLT